MILLESQMRKIFDPVYPWRDHSGKWSLVNNEYIPTNHVAQMLGLSRDTLLTTCGTLGVKVFNQSEVSATPISISYASYISIKSFPVILKNIGWKDEDIAEGMQGFEIIKSRSRHNKTKTRHVDDDEDDDEVLFAAPSGQRTKQTSPPSVEIELPPSPVVQRPKRSREEGVELPPPKGEEVQQQTPNGTKSVVHPPSGGGQQPQDVLNRMEALFVKSMDMLGDQALVTYVKTDMWTNKLQKALKDEVAKEMPSLRNTVKQELRAHYEPIIKAQIRKDYEDKLQNDNVEADAFHNVLHKKRFQTLAPPPTPNPPKGGFDSPPPPPGDGFDASVWVQAFLQSDKTE